MDRPDTQFAWNGDIALAYQVIGDSPSDLLYLQGWVSNVELNWDSPRMSRFLRELARSRRLIVADRRGFGCSERYTPSQVQPLETLVDDVLVVLDAAGSDRVAIVTTEECGFLGCMFAATHPDRTLGLVLYNASANYVWSAETPWEWTPERWDEEMEQLRRSFPSREAREEASRESAPSLLDNPAELEWWVRYQVLSVAPGANVAEGKRYFRTDIRPIQPSIHVPVLVLCRPEVWAGFRDSSRYLAEHIPGAARRELPGADSLLWLGDQHAVHQSIDAFLDEIRSEEAMFERTLATVLFTDVVDATARAAELGDRRWRDLVSRHHAIVRGMLARYRGTEIDTARDGFFASFDGPARAVRCAQAIVEAIRSLGIEVRAGVHTGEVEIIDRKIGGLAVMIGSRIGAQADASEVLVSQTVKDLVAGSGLSFEPRGEHEFKGVPGGWLLYAAIRG